MSGKPCVQGCQCGRHHKSDLHKQLIGREVKRAQEKNIQAGLPINQFPVKKAVEISEVSV